MCCLCHITLCRTLCKGVCVSACVCCLRPESLKERAESNWITGVAFPTGALALVASVDTCPLRWVSQLYPSASLRCMSTALACNIMRVRWRNGVTTSQQRNRKGSVERQESTEEFLCH